VIDLLADRRVVIALAVVGGVLAILSSTLALRGRQHEANARRLSYAGYAFMGASMVLFLVAGLRR
jgi:hypothetical protein